MVPCIFHFVGKCECGQCTCFPPGDSRVYGKHCECDDRQCEDLEGKICEGKITFSLYKFTKNFQ